MEYVTERVLLGVMISSTLFVVGWIVRVTQFLENIRHSALPVVIRLLMLVANNRLLDFIDIMVTVPLS